MSVGCFHLGKVVNLLFAYPFVVHCVSMDVIVTNAKSVLKFLEQLIVGLIDSRVGKEAKPLSLN